MPKPIINNREDLLREKERLKNDLRNRKLLMSESFSKLKDELNPFNAIGSVAKNTFSATPSNPFIKFGISRATDFLIGSVLLKRAGWLPRLIVPFAVKKISTALLSRKANKTIAKSLKTVAGKVRQVGQNQKPAISQKANIS